MGRKKKVRGAKLGWGGKDRSPEETGTLAATTMACEVMQELHNLHNADRGNAAANAWRATIYVRNRCVGNSFDDA
jgi:hypothetical protein